MSVAMWDSDIAALSLGDAEKDGLQVYRNYNKSFSDAREKQFAAGVDYAHPDLSDLENALSLLVSEDIRFVPVIACAFADEDLAEMFKRFLPEGIPGGKKAMLGRFGPVSTLFNRIQFAFAFDMVSTDILTALDTLRSHRNKISHTWNSLLLADFYEAPLPQMDELEAALEHRLRKDGDFDFQLTPEASMRMRSIWLVTRLFYETRCYPLAKLAQVTPHNALYGKNAPKLLTEVSKHAMHFTTKIGIAL
jgi:hypothetical protein